VEGTLEGKFAAGVEMCMLLYRGICFGERASRNSWLAAKPYSLWFIVACVKDIEKSCGCSLSAVKSMLDYMFFSLVDVLPSNTMKLVSEIVTMQIDCCMDSSIEVVHDILEL
jgi:hypothetical protein